MAISSTASNTANTSPTSKASTKAGFTDEKAASSVSKVDKEALHAKAKKIDSPKFEKIDPQDPSLEKEIQNNLKRFKVGVNKYNHAALSTDGQTLVITQDGSTTLAENFGGASKLGRFLYKVTGWVGKIFGAANKDVASTKYKEFFNNKSLENSDVSMVMEPLSHLYKGLSSNHYHGISVFHKDPSTGKFTKTPAAVSIVDSYKYIIQEHEKNNEIPPEILEHKSDFDDAYALDKTIPIEKSSHDFKKLYHQITEGLYAAQGFSFLTLPGQIHDELNVNTEDLNYIELPWHRVLQMSDKSWKVMTSKLDFDADAFFNDKDDKEFYLSKISDSKHSNITIVRPKEDADKAVEPYIGYIENWSQMYSGNALRAKSKDDQRLVELTQRVAQDYIKTYNEEYHLAS